MPTFLSLEVDFYFKLNVEQNLISYARYLTQVRHMLPCHIHIIKIEMLVV